MVAARSLAGLLALGLVAAACGADEDASAEDTVPTTAPEEGQQTTTTGASEDDGEEGDDPDTTEDGGDAEGAAAPFDEERCATNEAMGTVTYISSFDFAASGGIVDVIAAEAEGFFDEVCLDVEIQPGFVPSNGQVVASGQAQFSSAGSFGELVNSNVNGDAGLVAIGQYGHTAIEALLVPADSEIETLADVEGTTMGIKGDVPYSLQVMLADAGVERGSYEEILLDGFDPVAHLELGIDSLPVYKSNEPAQLDAQGIEYRMFDPLDEDIPASFGIMFTSQSFLDENPTVVQDFMRASLKGMEWAMENQEEAVAHCFDLINAAGNPNFLAEEGEGFRWTTESALIEDTTPEGYAIGQLVTPRLGDEIGALTEVGVFAEEPDYESMFDTSVVDELIDGEGDVSWPGE
ncbi:MAG: ABC transporter substrate-binding protein [Actinomycetota bacterium]|nr:ABC transporter substrate-binding protein [Actinomycetota bacterium]